MKLKNVTALPVQVFDEHAGRGALVGPGELTPELSELAALELAAHTAVWGPAEPSEPTTKPVRTSGRTKKES